MTPRRLAPKPTASCVALAIAVSGCASITGLDGFTDYECKAPVGVKCDSVSGTYYNALKNNLPSQRQRVHGVPAGQTPAAQPARQRGQAVSTAAGPSADTAASQPVAAAKPLRSPPRILRLWLKPWEDADHDLHGEGTVYVRVDNGEWLVDHVQRQIRDAYAPVRAPRPSPAASAPAAPDSSSRSPSPDRPGGIDGSPLSQTLKALQAPASRSGGN